MGKSAAEGEGGEKLKCVYRDDFYACYQFDRILLKALFQEEVERWEIGEYEKEVRGTSVTGLRY